MKIYKLSSMIATIELLMLEDIAEKIIKGNTEWTDRELQVQQNYPQILEILLKKKYDKITNK